MNFLIIGSSVSAYHTPYSMRAPLEREGDSEVRSYGSDCLTLLVWNLHVW